MLDGARVVVDALIPSTCAACDGPSHPDAPLCARCLEAVEAPLPQMGIACALFGGPIAHAIRAAKFGRDVTRAHALGTLWLQRLRSGAAPSLPDDVTQIAFVPTHWRRRVVRGFDMPAILAQHLAMHRANLRVIDALACARRDPPLSFGADKATRAVAVAGRYRVRPRAKPLLAGKRTLLVDDVKTTGATLNEAARVLTEAGADVVIAPFAIAP